MVRVRQTKAAAGIISPASKRRTKPGIRWRAWGADFLRDLLADSVRNRLLPAFGALEKDESKLEELYESASSVGKNLLIGQ